MSGYKNYFENSWKNMGFIVKDDDVLDKYKKIWDKTKKKFKKTLNFIACLFMMKHT